MKAFRMTSIWVAICFAAALAGCSSDTSSPGSTEDTKAAVQPPDASKGALQPVESKATDAAEPDAKTAPDAAKAAQPPPAEGSAPPPAAEPEPAVDLTAILPPLIEGFESPYPTNVFAAAEQFRQLPAGARRGVLVELSASDSTTVRANAWRAFSTWATRDDVPTLLTLLESPHEDVRIAVLNLLARFPSEQTIGVLLQALANPDQRERAEGLLIRCGPAAEVPLLPFAQHEDAPLRAAAWRVLGQIGARRSLLALTQLQTQEAFRDSPDLEDAVAKIKQRLRE